MDIVVADAKCAIAVDAVQIKVNILIIGIFQFNFQAFLPPSSMKVLQQFDWPILAHMSKKLSWTVIDFRNNLPSSLFSAISPRNHPQMPIKRTNRALRTVGTIPLSPIIINFSNYFQKHPLPPLCLQINLLVPGAVVEQVWSKNSAKLSFTRQQPTNIMANGQPPPNNRLKRRFMPEAVE